MPDKNAVYLSEDRELRNLKCPGCEVVLMDRNCHKTKPTLVHCPHCHLEWPQSPRGSK